MIFIKSPLECLAFENGTQITARRCSEVDAYRARGLDLETIEPHVTQAGEVRGLDFSSFAAHSLMPGLQAHPVSLPNVFIDQAEPARRFAAPTALDLSSFPASSGAPGLHAHPARQTHDVLGQEARAQRAG